MKTRKPPDVPPKIVHPVGRVQRKLTPLETRMKPPPGANPAPTPGPARPVGSNGNNAGYGRGLAVDPRESDKVFDGHVGNGDSLRLDMHQARNNSSARRQPTRQIEAEYDPERHGIADVDPAGGAFESTWSMSGRTPPPSSGTPAPQPRPVPAEPIAKRVEGNVAPRPVQVVRPSPAAAAAKSPSPLNKHVCPFCGMKRDDPTAICVGCGLPDNEGTRGATVARVGPWFVLQPRNPSAPGMRFSVLRELVRSGQVAAGSVVRGPATQQLWTYAARVRGLAHLFGVCWSCNRRLPAPKPGEEPDDFCVYCGAMQTAPTNPDQQLEALGTSETIGTGVSNLAGQVASALTGQSPIQYRETTPATPPTVRRPLPRLLPPAPRDGGDALLTTRELATAFNLDRKKGLMTSVRKVPWMRIMTTVIVVGGALFGLWLAAKVLLEPLTGIKVP